MYEHNEKSQATRTKKKFKTIENNKKGNSQNGDGTMLPVDFDAPNLYKCDAAIRYSMLAFTPKSLSVALIMAISSLIPDFLLTPA